MDEDILELDTERIEDFLDRYLELDRQAKQPEGVYSVLSGRRERKYQQTLRYFLDPNKPHGFGYTLLEVFLDVVGAPKVNVASQHVEIEEEVHIADPGSDGRIDLVICGGQALDDQPDWAVFLELKVGADENENQTPTYAAADEWQFSWFDSSTISVGELDADYAYVKKATADDPVHAEFTPVDWATTADRFDNQLQGSLFQYPNRSVIQLTDFVQSLAETENMDSPLDEDELTDRLALYFEFDDVIQQVEQAHREFENDFDEVSSHLTAQWADHIREQYDVAGSGWQIRSTDNPQYQGLTPAYWDQDPMGWNSTVEVYFQIPLTTEQLRKQELSFRLRLPPQRKVHINSFEGDRSFNTVFTEKCTGKYEAAIQEELADLAIDERKLGTASTLFRKEYDVDSANLISSNLAQVRTAVTEFCSENSELLMHLNTVFEDSYEEVFGESPAGEFSGPLQKQE